MEMTSSMNKLLVVLAGPTASGKSAVGINLAKHFNTEILSADSRQIYRETSIGTAVPSPDQLSAVPHHFIQSISLETYYNASMYEFDVLDTLEQLFKRHDLLFLVGGSGLYINAVCTGIDELPRVDEKIRSELAEQLKRDGLPPLVEKLKVLDPVSYEKIDLQNHFRVLKALEISIQTGRPYSSFLTGEKRERPFNIVRLALNMDRELLYSRINSRVVEMVESGLVKEVEGLQHLRHLNAMKTVGYREIFSHLDGKLSLEEAIDLIQRNTRKYARKQITWFRKGEQYTWFEPEDMAAMIEHIEQQCT